jgi:hypothetical protein
LTPTALMLIPDVRLVPCGCKLNLAVGAPWLCQPNLFGVYWVVFRVKELLLKREDYNTRLSWCCPALPPPGDRREIYWHQDFKFVISRRKPGDLWRKSSKNVPKMVKMTSFWPVLTRSPGDGSFCGWDLRVLEIPWWQRWCCHRSFTLGLLCMVTSET